MQLKFLFLTGNNDLVGGYPLSDLIYPPSFSKKIYFKKYDEILDKFCKIWISRKSTNSIKWEKYLI